MLDLVKAMFGMNGDAKAVRENSKRIREATDSIAEDFEAMAASSREFRKAAIPNEMGEFIDVPKLVAPPVKPKRRKRARA